MGFCKRRIKYTKLHSSVVHVLGLVVAVVAFQPAVHLWAHGAGGHGAGGQASPKPSAAADKPQPSASIASFADRPMQPRHGGQITASKHHYFEVVYTPSETRLYVYNASQLGINARYVKGDAVMTVRSSGQSGRFPLQVVAQPTFTGDLGYLVATVDVAQVQDGDMDVQFEIQKLPSEEPSVSFTQVFSLTRPPLAVRRDNLFAADRQPVIQQGICPVTETRLGDHGDPVKLMVGDRPVYVCCEGCVQEVQNDPNGYVQKTSHLVQVNSVARLPNPVTPQRSQITLAQLTANDRPLVQQQGTCPVMDEPLGSHGDPIKLMVDGHPLYVCCQGCVDQVEQNPYFFRDKATRNSIAARQAPPSPAGHDHRAHNHLPEPTRQPPPLSPPPVYPQGTSAPIVPAVAVVETTPADDAAIRAQQICPVMKQPLGTHGTPIKLMVDGQPLFVCCQGCVNQIQKAPLSYVSHSAYGQPLDRSARQDAWFYERPAPSGNGGGGSCNTRPASGSS